MTGIDKRLVVLIPFSALYVMYWMRMNKVTGTFLSPNQRLVTVNEFVVEELHGLWDSLVP